MYDDELTVKLVDKVAKLTLRVGNLERIEGTSFGGSSGSGTVLTVNNEVGILPLSRRFVAGLGVTSIDGGAGSTFTLDVGEGPGIDITANAVGLGGDSILLYDSGGNPIAEFAATETGLNAALAAATSGDNVVIPSMQITCGSPIIVPDGVEISGYGYNSWIDGEVTGFSVGNAYLSDLRVTTLSESNSLIPWHPFYAFKAGSYFVGDSDFYSSDHIYTEGEVPDTAAGIWYVDILTPISGVLDWRGSVELLSGSDSAAIYMCSFCTTTDVNAAYTPNLCGNGYTVGAVWAAPYTSHIGEIQTISSFLGVLGTVAPGRYYFGIQTRETGKLPPSTNFGFRVISIQYQDAGGWHDIGASVSTPLNLHGVRCNDLHGIAEISDRAPWDLEYIVTSSGSPAPYLPNSRKLRAGAGITVDYSVAGSATISVPSSGSSNMVAVWASSTLLTYDANALQVNPTTHRVGINTDARDALLQIGYGVLRTDYAAPYTLAIGRANYLANGKLLIGFGYNTTLGANLPAAIGFDMTNIGGATLGDLVFAARNTTTATDPPVERMRIKSTGVVQINGMTTAGYLKNDVSGNLSGGNSIYADLVFGTSITSVGSALSLAGTSGSATRSDHKHQLVIGAGLAWSGDTLTSTGGVDYGTDITDTGSSTSAAGTSGSAARSDHKHKLAIGTGLSWSGDILSSTGGGASLGSDIQPISGDTTGSGTSGSAAPSDHAHGLIAGTGLAWVSGSLVNTCIISGSASDITSGSAAGTSGSAAQSDHAHKLNISAPLVWAGSVLGVTGGLGGSGSALAYVDRANSFATGTQVFNASEDASSDFRVAASGSPNMLFVDASEGRVGINTNAPGSGALAIVQTSDSIAGGLLVYESTGSFAGGIYREALTGGSLVLRNNSIDTLLVFNGGISVGNGTDIAGLITINRNTAVANQISSGFVFNRYTTGTPAAGLGSGIAMQIENDAGVLYNAVRVSAELMAVESGSEVGRLSFWAGNGANNASTAASRIMSVHGNGNVGIGVLTPTSKLDVSGSAAFTGGLTSGSPIISTLAVGTAPFSVTSTTMNTNLNADLLDGSHGAAFQPALTTGSASRLAYWTSASGLDYAGLLKYTAATGRLELYEANGGGSFVMMENNDLAIGGNGIDATCTNLYWGTSVANLHYGYQAGSTHYFYSQSTQPTLTLASGSGTFCGGVVINENGHSAGDVRIEGDAETALLFTDASEGTVGIGTNTPLSRLDIRGTYAGTSFTAASTNTSSNITNVIGVNLAPNLAPTGASLTNVMGMANGPVLKVSTPTTISNFYGMYSRPTLDATFEGTVTKMFGLRIVYPIVTNGSCVGIAGLVIDDTLNGTNNTNVLLGTTTVPTGNYSIYDASAYNSYIASSLGIGDTAATVKLSVYQSVASTANLLASITRLANFTVDTVGTARIYMGGQIGLRLEDATGGKQDAAMIDWQWTDATRATRTSQIAFETYTSGSPFPAVNISGSGLESYDIRTLGSELVNNGTFTTGSSPWTASSVAVSLDTSGSNCKITMVTGTTSGAARTPAITVVSGKRYRVQATYYGSASGSSSGSGISDAQLWVGNAVGVNTMYGRVAVSDLTATTTLTIDFVAQGHEPGTAETVFISLYHNLTSAAGLYMTWDDVTLKEVIAGDIIARGKFTGGGSAGMAIDTASGSAVFSGPNVRMSSANYRRYYHMPLFASNPGASGATFVPPSANTTGGYRLDAAGEVVYAEGDIHADWDGASDITVEVKFMVNVASVGAGNTVDLKMVCYYKGIGETATKTQTVEVPTTVGTVAQYTSFEADFTIDWDAASNVIEVGDVITFVLNLETDTSEVDDIVVTNCSMNYRTTHIGIEAGDV